MDTPLVKLTTLAPSDSLPTTKLISQRLMKQRTCDSRVCKFFVSFFGNRGNRKYRNQGHETMNEVLTLTIH